MGFVHWPAYLIAPVIAIPIFIKLGLYRAIIRYIGYRAQWTVIKAVSLAVLVWWVAVYLMALELNTPRSVIFIFWLVAVLVIGGSRMMARWVILYQFPGGDHSAQKDSERVLIYGAGTAGRQLATALHHSSEFVAVAYIDDDSSLRGMDINGIRVYSPSDIGGLVERYDINAVLLAIPSVSRYRRKTIVDSLSDFQLRVLTLPALSDIAGGKVTINDVREVDIADLLGREEVLPNQDLLAACILNQSVMVTGAGGSIGSELCRQIVNQRPSSVILYEQSEYALYTIEQELSKLTDGLVDVVPVLGSVLDRVLLQRVIRQYHVDTIYHAAAYKHVPLVESNVVAGVRNNLFGTLNTAEVAIDNGVKNFVLISTDKAVRPTNVMGASKRFAELVLQALSKREQGSGVRFAMVRFGNVLGSSGSVIPLFRQQISHGGPVTVTHPDITRYFMTIPEASSLVIQAGSMGASGDVFVLDMGKAVKIKSLAKQMINLTGLSVKDENHPDGDIEIIYTGLRDGEKLYEELLIGDNVKQTAHPMIMQAEELMIEWGDLVPVIAQMQLALDSFDYEAIRSLLLESVNGYHPLHGIKDPMYSKGSAQVL
ncbi:NDP-sugar epimerase, includes UDP-GlcNAc-inverting 4,6-dehydratase FlaA1 and capsular polysaccharide biosynthesis protein EpsC [Amphritea atlantica]|uniref:NDP-sugar epimerase, includes UDP-GlcNAc-inverting 4,6-dehydratase FlaA1 and capsular polysaccharide biosynthesis protein EpsC n=1 Tax=Amphritea atlantica TaxID=355243 RepID=A0A1H9L5A0_9GAMM|nr:nucleoside-diphosphate sugar epimerase/dehydratase [Amphritea atlantica]SER06671.1 NDP-sugar epimerase, includes UDP-GlcNAc-inverting 4,6-dehydratase FlaA1 and capsular polysaccharide biosynthesis protein EpsC [Amphritea atlantica]